MDIAAGQNVLVVVTWGTTTYCYETVTRRVTTYALEVDHPRADGKKVAFREGDHLLIVTEPDREEFYFLDTLFLSLDGPEVPTMTLLLHGKLLKTPNRQHLRTLVNVPVQVFPQGPAAPEPFKTQSVNLSCGGVLVPAPYSLPHGAPVVVSLLLPERKQELRLRASLRRAEVTSEHGDTDCLLAFEFSTGDAPALATVAEFVNRNQMKIIRQVRTQGQRAASPPPPSEP